MLVKRRCDGIDMAGHDPGCSVVGCEESLHSARGCVK